MPQDVLNPQDEKDAAQDRQVKPLKHPGGVERPQTVPTLGQAEGSGTMEGTANQQLPISGQSVQPQQDPSDAIFNDLFYGGAERLSPDRYHAISGNDIKMVHDPLEEIQNNVEAQIQGLSPENRFQSLSRSQFIPQYQQDITTDYDSIDDKVQASISKVQEQNDRIVELNRIGFNGNNLSSNGQLKAPSLDTDIAGRGLSSELAKAIEDRLKIDIPGFGDDRDPRFSNNEHGEYRDLVDGIFGLGQFAEDFAESKLPGWLVKPWVKARDGIREKLGIKDWVEERGRQGVEKISQQTQPTNKVDPNANEWGDYGSGGIGAALYWTNLVPSVIAGSIYDFSDSIITTITGKNPYEGSRILDAITKGRDWGLSNRWSEEKYLSLMEPEGLKPGQLTGNWWWDLPEQVSKATGGLVNERVAHWLIQLPVAVASEIVLDVPGDYLWDKGIDLLRKGGKVPTKLADEPVSALAERSKLVGEGVEAIPPFYETTIYKELPELAPGLPNPPKEVTIDIPYRQEQLRGTVSLLPPAIDEIYPTPKPPDIAGTLPYYKPSNLIDVEAKFNKVNPPNLDENGFLTSQIRRDSLTLTEIGKNVRNPFNPKESLIPRDSFPLSENTLSVLENLEPLAMGRFGKVVDVEAINSPQLLLPGNQVLDVPALPPSTYLDPSPSILGVNETVSLDSLLKKQLTAQDSMVRAITAGEDYKPIYEQFKRATIQVQLKKAQLLDSGQLYPTIKNELPDQLNATSSELIQTGEIMLQAEFNLTNLTTQREVLEAELIDLSNKWKSLNDRIEILGDIGRQDVELSLRTEDWSSDDFIPEYQLDDGLTQPDVIDDFGFGDDFFDFGNTSLPDETPQADPSLYSSEPIRQRNAEDYITKIKESVSEGYGDDDSFRNIQNYIYNFIENKIPDSDTSEIYNVWKNYLDGSHLVDGEDLQGNDYLRKLREGTPLNEAEQRSIENLDKLLEVLPKVEGDNLVRGVRLRNKLNYKFADGYPDLSNLQVGDIATFPEYLSASYGAYNNFTAGSQYILNIKSNRGSLLFNPLEEEVLLPRNSSFKVTDIEKTNNNKTIISLEDVTDSNFTKQQQQPFIEEVVSTETNKQVINIPSNSLAEPTETPFLFHGTRLDPSVPINSIDPIVGGSPSEFGLGVYLTTKQDVSLAAAKKYDTINKPPTFNVSKGTPNQRVIDTSRLNNIIDLNKSIPKDVKDVFKEAAFYATGNKTFSDTFLKDVKKTGLAWNAFREKYFNSFGTAAPEGLVRKFQQYVSTSFKNTGIDAGRFDETLVVYNNKLLVETKPPLTINITNNTLESALEAQRFLDGQTLAQLGDNVSQANYLNSNKELSESLMKTTQRELTEIQGQTIDELTTSLDMEDKLIRGTAEEARKRIDDANTNLERRTIEEYGIKEEIIEDSPCPPLPDEFYRGMK